MPRFPMVEKTVQGKKVTQTQFLNAVVQEIIRVGDPEEGARVGDLISGLGDEWDTTDKRRFLAATLHNLARRDVLIRPKTGCYKVSPHYHRVGVNPFDEIEKSILKVIRAEGGFCRFRDIMEAHGARVTKGDAEIANTSEHFRLMQVMRQSTLIRQDFITRGIYNLPWEEVAGLPLRGRWAAMIIKLSYTERRERRKLPVIQNDWRAIRDDFFFQVGSAFKRLRMTDGLTIPQLLEDRKVLAAVLDFVRKAPGEEAVIRQQWFDLTTTTVQKMRDEGRDAEVEQYREDRAEEFRRRLPEWLYKRFEQGMVGAHANAPLLFYTTLAAHYECCPAALSRGLVAVRPYDDVRIRPTPKRRHMMEMIEQEVEIEQMNEYRLRMIYGEDEAEFAEEMADLVAEDNSGEPVAKTDGENSR